MVDCFFLVEKNKNPSDIEEKHAERKIGLLNEINNSNAKEVIL